MNNRQIKVLLIENDPDDAFLIKENFAEIRQESISFQVKWVAKLEEGLTTLENENVDVVILDLVFPGSQGFDVIVKVHKISPIVPVVVLTALDDEHVALEALSRGAQDYLVKGDIDASLLVRSIRYAIERSQLLSRLEQSSEDRFLKIIDKSADAMAVVDEKGIVQFVNPACQILFGQRPEDIVGRSFRLPLTDNPFLEQEIVLRNGEKKIVQMRLSEIEWEKKTAKLASIRDITLQQKLESLKREMNERKRLDQIKDEFISTVSHELRTPLTTIKSAVENLKDGISGILSEKQTHVIDIANRNVDRLARIINDLLDLSRLESGKAKIYRRRVEVVPLLKEILQNFQMVAKERHLTLEGHFTKNLPPVYADPDMLVQVLSNLLDNALRVAKTKVVVDAKTVEKNIQFTVSDDGFGIPEDKIKSLFSKFVQLDRPMGGAGYKGTGLGLSICKEIIDRHGSRIWVTSNVGEGAHFHFLLRQYDEEGDFRDILQQSLKGAEDHHSKMTLFLIAFVVGKEERISCFPEIEEKIRMQVLRKGDFLLARPGRAEMIVIAAAERDGASALQRRIKKLLEEFKLGFQIGTSLFPDDASEPEKLLQIANGKMQGDKNDGR